jgi:undecaprenyl pyrophosphate phosphatase UppP
VAQSILGSAVSLVVGYLSIHPLVRLVRRARLWWFSVYLWLVGAVVITEQLVR